MSKKTDEDRTLTERLNLCRPLPWQHASWEKLIQQHRRQRLPHGLLLAGDEGVGKNNLALALAHRLLCDSPANEAPCGQCRGCELNESRTHPDLHVLSPGLKSAVIKIDQVRDVMRATLQTAQMAGARVIVITPAEALNLSSANALLKHLEEPGRDTYFILVSNRPGALPATVRSRCQRVSLATPQEDSVLPWLQPYCDSEQEAKELLSITRGRPVAALAIAEGGGTEQEAALLQGLDALVTGKINPSDMANLFKGETPETVLLRLLNYVESYVVSELSGQERPRGELQSAMILHEELQNLYRRVSGAQNPNTALMLEHLCIKVKQVLGQ